MKPLPAESQGYAREVCTIAVVLEALQMYKDDTRARETVASALLLVTFTEHKAEYSL